MLSPGYDYGYVCVEFSLLEDAIGCMEANQVALYFGQMMLEGYIFYVWGGRVSNDWTLERYQKSVFGAYHIPTRKRLWGETLEEAGKVSLQELMDTHVF